MDSATELEWLQWFYGHIGDALGPADDEIFQLMKDGFTEETGKAVPKGY